jgi:plasmid stability protein
MADLVVRDIDDDIIQALQERAECSGRSVEAQHRLILTQALLVPEKRIFAAILAAMPDVGRDLERSRCKPSTACSSSIISLLA